MNSSPRKASTGAAAGTPKRERQPHPWRGYVYIAVAALLWAVSAALGRAVFTGGLVANPQVLTPQALAQARTTIAFLLLAPVLLARRGASGLRLGRADLLRALAIGIVGLAGSNYFYYLAIQQTNVATAIILQYMAPVWVLLYMVARGLQRATLRRVASVALAVFGSALAIGLLGSAELRINTLGLIAAEGAALTFAFYNIAIPKLLERHDRWKVLLYLLLGAAAFWTVLNPPWRVVAMHYSVGHWAFLATFSITSALVPFSFYIAGLQYLDATRAIVTSCLEPVFAVLVASSVLGESLTAIQALGIALVLVATILIQLPARNHARAVSLIEPVE